MNTTDPSENHIQIS